MKNYIQHGDTVSLTAPTGGVVSGNGYLIGTLFVFAVHDALATAAFEGKTEGVFSLPKLSAQAWTEGAKIYWDGTNAEATTVATGNTEIGKAVAVAANPSSLGTVRLNGS